MEYDRECEKHFVSGRATKSWDKYNVDWVPTLNLGHNMTVKRQECHLKRNPAKFDERQKGIEAEKEAKRQRPARQIQEIDTKSGEQQVKTGTQSKEFYYLLGEPDVAHKSSFDRCEFEKNQTIQHQ